MMWTQADSDIRSVRSHSSVKEFPADERLLTLAEEACREANPDISTFKGRVASGDQFIDSKEKKKWIRDTFDAYCAEMEGAAVAQAAYLNKIPYLIVRAISDKADDSAHMDYGEFEAKAVEHSVNLILALVKDFDFVITLRTRFLSTFDERFFRSQSSQNHSSPL